MQEAETTDECRRGAGSEGGEESPGGEVHELDIQGEQGGVEVSKEKGVRVGEECW